MYYHTSPSYQFSERCRNHDSFCRDEKIELEGSVHDFKVYEPAKTQYYSISNIGNIGYTAVCNSPLWKRIMLNFP